MDERARIELAPGRSVSEHRVRQQLARFQEEGDWPRGWGPPPGSDGCRIPRELLRDRGPVSFSGGRPRVTFHLLDGIPPIPPRDDIVAGLFQPGELVLLVGEPKAGKSALAVHLSRAVASGTPFLGRATRRVAVAYAARERPRETVRRLRAAGADGLPIFVSRDRPALGEQDDVDALIEALQEASNALREDLPLGLIIVDTARKAFRGLRENDAASVSIGLDDLRRLLSAVPTAAVVLVHHLGKEGSSARGSGAILADADLELTVFNRGGRRTIEVTGANAVEEAQVLPFALTVTDLDGEPVVGISDDPAIRQVSFSGARPDAPLPRDAAEALRILSGMPDATLSAWRERMMAEWSDRRRGSARQAFSKARTVLEARSCILVDGDRVSVSNASAGASADGAKASAPSVSAPPPLGGSADVADDAGSGTHTRSVSATGALTRLRSGASGAPEGARPPERSL